MTKPDKKIIRGLKSYYRSNNDNLGSDFFKPCLEHCSAYNRAAGYFTSSVLKTWASVLPGVLNKKDVNISLIISPELSQNDLDALRMVSNMQNQNKTLQEIADNIVLDAIKYSDDPGDQNLQLKLLASMIASGRLVLKFAFPEHISNAGMYHEKIGVFEFPWGDKLAFTGSANETGSGHESNFESIQVFRSWVDGDKDRVENIGLELDLTWNDSISGLKVLSMSNDVLKQVKAYSHSKKKNTTLKKINKWRHQDEAVEGFLKNPHGILEMATGTGKTRTSLIIISELIRHNKLNSFIVCTEGTDLLSQWHIELIDWNKSNNYGFAIYCHYGDKHQGRSFAISNKLSILIISRQQLSKVLKVLKKNKRDNMAIIHDEVHKLGSAANVKKLKGEHASFGYTLGLSATPDRMFDQEGTDFIREELGEFVYKFDLKDAIKRGILCEFEYVALQYELTESDIERRKNVYKQKAARRLNGNPMSSEEMQIALSKVYKLAEQKPSVFEEYYIKNPSIINNTIIFVESTEFGEKVLNKLHRVTNKYRTYYQDDDKENLIKFSRGEIDCLVTCHKISEGIDITRLENVVIFSSSTTRLETIQRIGRCLRIDPNNLLKKAKVVDFIVQEDRTTADSEREEWLEELSTIKHEIET
jgi:superfamily II DNA or RNA helicase